MIRTRARGLALRALATRRKSNVAMLHIGRCGSTVVARLIQTHPRVHWAGELFQGYVRQLRDGGLDPFGDWDREMLKPWLQPEHRFRASMLKAGCRTYGVELKFFHIRAMGESVESTLELLETLSFDHFILLHRRNVLRKIVSSIRAESMGYYHLPVTGPSQPLAEQDLRTTVNLKDVLVDQQRGTLLDTIKRIESDVAEARQALENRNSLTLVYENHVERDPRVAAIEALEFMGLSPRNLPEPSLRRINPQPLAAMIANYDEMREYLASSPYAWMLEE